MGYRNVCSNNFLPFFLQFLHNFIVLAFVFSNLLCLFLSIRNFVVITSYFFNLQLTTGNKFLQFSFGYRFLAFKECFNATPFDFFIFNAFAFKIVNNAICTNFILFYSVYGFTHMGVECRCIIFNGVTNVVILFVEPFG